LVSPESDVLLLVVNCCVCRAVIDNVACNRRITVCGFSCWETATSVFVVCRTQDLITPNVASSSVLTL